MFSQRRPISKLRLSGFPAVLNERARLPEAEKAYGIGAGFVEIIEIAQQHIRHRISCGIGTSGSLEGHVAGCGRSSVLIDAVANQREASFKNMLAVDIGRSVGNLDIRGRREKRKGRSLEIGETIDSDIGNAVGVPWVVALIQGLELEAIGGAFPGVAVWRNVLRCPARVGVKFVDDGRRW